MGSAHVIRWILVALLLTGCGAPLVARQGVLAGGPPYDIGPYRVSVYRTSFETDRACRRLAGTRETPRGQILGCYDPDSQTILTVTDWDVILHEFKHALEEWEHK